MCGRYAASASQELLEEIFEIDQVLGPLPQAKFNTAPTDPVPAVLERMVSDDPQAEPVRRLVPLRWGLVPSWSADAKGAARMINARVETVTSKPAFRTAMASRRCLLPADGYYEWYPLDVTEARGKPLKQPYFIRPADGGLFVMAGLYEFWKDPSGEWLATTTVITTRSTDAIGRIHDRMPLVVPRENWQAWLDPRRRDGALDLVAPHADLEAYPVSMLVNRVANDGPELIRPLPTV
ncbi:MAG: SOS response-associated peptidase [Micropruina sp.]|nr:SOS response-associated peptidase [Micropruina sp.]